MKSILRFQTYSFCTQSRVVYGILLWLAGWIPSVQAQPTSNDWTWSRSHATAAREVQKPLVAGQTLLQLPDATQFAGLPVRVQSATVRVQLDLGAMHKLASNERFSVEGMTFGVEMVDKNGNPQGSAVVPAGTTLSIHTQKPVAVYSLSFVLPVPTGAATDVVALRLILKNPPVATPPGLGRFTQSAIQDMVRVQFSYDIDYGLDARQVSIQAGSVLPNGTKYATFSWLPMLNSEALPERHIVPNYQFQLIRLYNQQEPEQETDAGRKAKILNGTGIYTNIDWSKALTIETDNSTPSLRLLLAEGSGFYAWRVRAIGSYHAGGIANSQNYGVWSSTSTSSPSIAQMPWLQINSLPDPKAQGFIPISSEVSTQNISGGFQMFHFTDSEEDKVYIYSRTFTEGNRETQNSTRISEKITYASPLQQGKQTQAHLPSQGTTLSSQTIYDYSNRPAVSTLPVPTQAAGLDGYKHKMVVAENSDGNRPYNAEHIDTKPAQTTAVDQTKGGFDYYNGKNQQPNGINQNVPDAEGFPFTRSRFYNDGTNRPMEQSGVGKTHAIGEDKANPDATGKTVKTYYETASDIELVRLFGDEAPAGESVLKTITIDQNGTRSITYTSKEGKVIATCLAFQEQDKQGQKGAKLAPLESGKQDVVKNEDVITSNVRQEGMLVSAKRVVFDTPTTVTIGYTAPPKNDRTFGCLNEKLDCKFQVYLYIRKLDDPFEALPALPAVEDPTKPRWAALETTTPYTTLMYTQQIGFEESVSGNAIKLPEGTYLIEKQLVPLAAETVVENSIQKMEEQIVPLKNLIQNWLTEAQACGTLEKMRDFYSKLQTLSERLEDAKENKTDPNALFDLGTTGTIDAGNYGLNPKQKQKDGTEKYVAFFTKDHSLKLVPPYNENSSSLPRELRLNSPCCSDLKIDVSYALPPFDFNTIDMTESSVNGEVTRSLDGKPGAITVNPFLASQLVLPGEQEFLADGTTENPAAKRGEDMTEFFPDFEGYAYSFFWECVADQTKDDVKVNEAKNAFKAQLAALANEYTTQINKAKDQYNRLFKQQFIYTKMPSGKNTAATKALIKTKMAKLDQEITKLNQEKTVYEDYAARSGELLDGAALNMGTTLLSGDDLTDAQRRIRYIYYAILAPNMIGWHEPGTFNLMVQKMLKDQYDCGGKNIVKDTEGNIVLEDGKPKKVYLPDRPPAVMEASCDGVAKAKPTPCATQTGACNQVQYDAQQLYKCWINKLMYLKATTNICEKYEDDFSEKDKTASTKVDDGDGNHDSHIDDNIDVGGGFIVKLFARRKIRKAKRKMAQEVRNMQTPQGSNAINLSPGYHLVEEFLNCTGYRFARILTNVPGTINEKSPAYTEDIYPGYTYDVPTPMPSPMPDKLPSIPGIQEQWKVQGSWKTYDGKNRGYHPYNGWKASRVKNQGSAESPSYKAERIFTQSKDPVYAFKYFEYVYNSQPTLEFATCFINPNVYQSTQIPICKDKDNTTPVLCDFCGIGKVRCDITHTDWTAGQRFAFYQRLQNSIETEETEFFAQPQAGDYTAPGFMQNIPNYIIRPALLEQPDVPESAYAMVPAFIVWEERDEIGDDPGDVISDILEKDAYNSLKDKKFVVDITSPQGQKTPLRLRSKVEIDLTAINDNVYTTCENRRTEFEQQLRNILTAKCYQVGGCKLREDDNIVPEKDFYTMVEIMVDECRRRGQIDTYRIIDSECIPYETREGVMDDETGQVIVPKLSVATVEYGVQADATGCQVMNFAYQYKTELNDKTADGTQPESQSYTKVSGTQSPIPQAAQVPSSWQVDDSQKRTPISIWDCSGLYKPTTDKEPTYVQWNRYREVTQMKVTLNIGLPDKCSPPVANTTPLTPDNVCTTPAVGTLDAPNVSANTLPAVPTASAQTSTSGQTTPAPPTYRSTPTTVGLKYEVGKDPARTASGEGIKDGNNRPVPNIQK